MNKIDKYISNKLERHVKNQLSSSVSNNIDGLNFFQKILFKFFSIFQKEEEKKLLEAPIDPRPKFIASSKAKIKNLEKLFSNKIKIDGELVVGNNVVIADILRITNDIHNRFVDDINLVPHKLERFHIYYTNNLFNLLDKLIVVDTVETHERISHNDFIIKAIKYKNKIFPEYYDDEMEVLRSKQQLTYTEFNQVNEYLKKKKKRDGSTSLMFVKESAKVDNSLIFYFSYMKDSKQEEILFRVVKKSSDEFEFDRIFINPGFKKRIAICKECNSNRFDEIKLYKTKKSKVSIMEISSEQFKLLSDYKVKIEEFFINLDGKQEAIELEMANLKSAINTNFLDV